MSIWTPEAKQELERYFHQVREPLECSGVDVTEVIEDLRRHIDEETAAANIEVVTETEVKQMLARLGEPENLPRAAVANPPDGVPQRFQFSTLFSVMILTFGILLPVGTIIFEWLSGACAATLFDPIPSFWHIMMVSFVPLANWAVWDGIRCGRFSFSRQFAWINGLAVGIAFCFALTFLPVTPFAFIGIFFMGFGFLPLAPLSSCIAAVCLRWKLRTWTKGTEYGLGLPQVWVGFLLGIGLVFVSDLPIWVTHIGLNRAVSDQPEQRASGITWLRALGQEETLLRACYGRGRMSQVASLPEFILGFDRPITPDAARQSYYRVMGRPFNSVPPPKIRTARGEWEGLSQFSWDAEQGQTQVGARLKGLSMRGSRIDGIIDPEPALTYFEWTMDFHNSSAEQREARAQIQLPPGAVVSRLTLWINGEEHEAAFGGRNQVRTAYQNVVVQRRDPVLVTTCGPDRVLVQCFPVPPNGGTMKVRIGVTSPMVLTSSNTAAVPLPALIERNYALGSNFKQSVWIESPSEMFLGQTRSYLTGNKHFLRKEFGSGDLGSEAGCIVVTRDPAVNEVWTEAAPATQGGFVQGTLREASAPKPKALAVVVDGSVGMKTFLGQIADSIGDFESGLKIEVIQAADTGPSQVWPLQSWDPSQRGAFQEKLRHLRAVGGQDNVNALERAWDDLAPYGGSILWIHGPQPEILDSPETLRQRFERAPGLVRLYDLEASLGPNRILEQMDGIADWARTPRLSSFREDCSRTLNLIASGKPQLGWDLRWQQSGQSHAGVPCSGHLARVWALGEIKRLLRIHEVNSAIDLAVQSQLVTPVSGAVVLERQEQYYNAGLTPVDPATVPSIPEPSTWILLAAGLVLLVMGQFLFKRSSRLLSLFKSP